MHYIVNSTEILIFFFFMIVFLLFVKKCKKNKKLSDSKKVAYAILFLITALSSLTAYGSQIIFALTLVVLARLVSV